MTHVTISTEEVHCEDCGETAYIETYITYVDGFDGPIMDGDEPAEFIDDQKPWGGSVCPPCRKERNRWCDECGEVDVSGSGNSTCSDCLPEPEPEPEPEPSSDNSSAPRIGKDYDSVRWGNGI